MVHPAVTASASRYSAALYLRCGQGKLTSQLGLSLSAREHGHRSTLLSCAHAGQCTLSVSLCVQKASKVRRQVAWGAREPESVPFVHYERPPGHDWHDFCALAQCLHWKRYIPAKDSSLLQCEAHDGRHQSNTRKLSVGKRDACRVCRLLPACAEMRELAVQWQNSSLAKTVSVARKRAASRRRQFASGDAYDERAGSLERLILARGGSHIGQGDQRIRIRRRCWLQAVATSLRRRMHLSASTLC